VPAVAAVSAVAAAHEHQASPAPGMKLCPYCAEEIRAEAVVCRYCGKNLTAPVQTATAAQTPIYGAAPTGAPLSPEANKKLEEAINRYRYNGYNLISRMQNMAIMERRAPIAAGLMVMWILVAWIGAIIYGIESTRKKYTVQIMSQPDGNVMITGGTIDEMESDKKRNNTIGWIIAGVLLALVLCVIIVSVAQNM
jgi:hypothetical protein